MNTLFYPKLALSNIKKNLKLYLPYILTCIFTSAMYYIICSLSKNSGLEQLKGGQTVSFVLQFGVNIIGFFSFIFLFYTNSFLTKNRRREFGLFNILGMEKRHIVRVTAFESLFTAIISLSLGIGAGILLDKLMYAVILKIMNTEIQLGFYVSGEGIVSTLILFAVIFVIIFLNSVRLVHLSKPIELLNGGKTGEKEPRAKWLISLLGVICLGAGYYISFTVKNPIMAIELFFVAVILVIIGTYLLFTSGSIALLKLLKYNKNYYYKTGHFISVSGMLYRMKQNAVGLANICILSTMVLVMLSSTSSLIIGIENVIQELYPFQFNLTLRNINEKEFDDFTALVRKTVNLELSEGEKITSEQSLASLEFSAVYDGKESFYITNSHDLSLIDSVYVLQFITAGDYERIFNREVSLAENEVIISPKKNSYQGGSITILDNKFNVKEISDSYIRTPSVTRNIAPFICVVLPDMTAMENISNIQKQLYGNHSSDIEFKYGFDTSADTDEQLRLYGIIRELAENSPPQDAEIIIDCRERERTDFLSLYGSLFFLGIFLGVLFTAAAVLIIYYKQISEGYEDKKRFEIMQKVGLSPHEVKSSIHSQIITVFFLPLVTAGIHTAAAFPIIHRILVAVFGLTDTGLIVLCTVGVFAAFALVYAAVYMLTARLYYNIVKN